MWSEAQGVGVWSEAQGVGVWSEAQGVGVSKEEDMGREQSWHGSEKCRRAAMVISKPNETNNARNPTLEIGTKETKRRDDAARSATHEKWREMAGEGKRRGANLHVRQNHLVSVQAGANSVGLGVLNKAEHDLA